MLTGYVYIDYGSGDAGTYIREAEKRLASFKVPDGYRIEWSGDYERIQSIRQHLKTVIPLTILLILILIYTSTRSYVKTGVVLLSFPFALAGAFWLLYLLGYHMSTAVWVGLIALAGLDAETDVVMLLYLDLSHNRWKEEGRLKGLSDLRDAVRHGAVKRLRPKLMTLGTTLIGLVPILFSTGIGSEIMKSIAAPMIGGLVTSTLLELIIYPSIYMLWKKREMAREMEPSLLSAI
jgi:Cu(I)/Ag(I) efflux system membrane protein CusA/SilA